MKFGKRKFIKYLSFSVFSILLVQLKLLVASTKKFINPNLSDQQKKIMFKEGTETPFSSELLKEKEMVFIIVQIVALNFFHRKQNLIVALDGLHFQKLFPMPFKQKSIILLE